jgi:hypothetical protein
MTDPQTESPAKINDISASDAMATLKMYVDLANSERQAIWARNAAMLVGNSFIINAIKSEPAKSEAGLNLFFSVAGIAICILWAIMTWEGWTWFYKSIVDARKLPIVPQLNPFASYGKNFPDRHADTIFKCTMTVIVIFSAMYVASIKHFYGVK